MTPKWQVFFFTVALAALMLGIVLECTTTRTRQTWVVILGLVAVVAVVCVFWYNAYSFI